MFKFKVKREYFSEIKNNFEEIRWQKKCSSSGFFYNLAFAETS